jgi:hypothetical protein
MGGEGLWSGSDTPELGKGRDLETPANRSSSRAPPFFVAPRLFLAVSQQREPDHSVSAECSFSMAKETGASGPVALDFLGDSKPA